MSNVPIWVGAPGIIVLVLVGVLISPMLMDAAGVASGSQLSGHETETDRSRGHDSGDDMERDGGHGSGDEAERSGHNQGQGGPLAPPEQDLAAASSQVVNVAIGVIPVVQAETAAQRGGRA